MGRFATGVTIVTTRLGDELHGMTANAVASVSLTPMLVLVCVDRSAETHDILARSRIFALNVLAREQADIARRFSKKEAEESHNLDGMPYRPAANGCPIIEGALAYIACRTVSEVPAGDHTVFIGEVVEIAVQTEGEPLVFYGGKFGGFTEGD